ncbi:MAG TPA: GNAT family N-acetyltransferase [Verrucomicrobiae bacterium]|nr:GNAT family N-acetyltransferase [Verrucomicrobiae bacterium]
MPDAIGLRPAEPADEPFLLRVYGSTRAEELAQTNWSVEEKSAFVQMQFSAQTQFYQENYEGAEYLIVLCDQRPGGRLYVHRTQEEIRVMDIALLPEFRGKGIGTLLLNQLFAEGRSSGKSVGIHVEIFNPAVRLYQRLGFRKMADKGVYHFYQWFPDSQVKQLD